MCVHCARGDRFFSFFVFFLFCVEHFRIRAHNLLTELFTLYDYWGTQLIFAYQFNWHRISSEWQCIGIENAIKVDIRVDQCVVKTTRANYQVHAVRLACIKKRLKCNMQ